MQILLICKVLAPIYAGNKRHLAHVLRMAENFNGRRCVFDLLPENETVDSAGHRAGTQTFDRSVDASHLGWRLAEHFFSLRCYGIEQVLSIEL